jgi:hypothetical protein
MRMLRSNVILSHFFNSKNQTKNKMNEEFETDEIKEKEVGPLEKRLVSSNWLTRKDSYEELSNLDNILDFKDFFENIIKEKNAGAQASGYKVILTLFEKIEPSKE